MTPAAIALAAACWPGGLTLVVSQRPGVELPSALTGGSPTIGLRVPAHDAPRTLARAVGPLPVTSANVSGLPEAGDVAGILAQLGEAVDLVLDGGPAHGTPASTVGGLLGCDPGHRARGGDRDGPDRRVLTAAAWPTTSDRPERVAGPCLMAVVRGPGAGVERSTGSWPRRPCSRLGSARARVRGKIAGVRAGAMGGRSGGSASAGKESGDHDHLRRARPRDRVDRRGRPRPVGGDAGERRRQHEKIELIASENYVSAAVMEAQGSWLTNKYAEGLPGKRYYGGCEYVDIAERLAQDRALALFPGAEHVNVQPHSGAQANMAAYFSVLQPGDRILGMNLAHGGHLTHGMALNFSGKLYEVHAYGVRQDDERIDYDAMEAQAKEVRPKLIVGGASAYPRIWDFERMAAIAHAVGAILFVDMAHIAGLVAAGVHPSPFPHADIVTSTTHKTLRGPRGGLIFARAELPPELDAADFPALKGSLGAAIDKTVFPGVQGGPLMQVIAGKAVAFKLAAEETFRADQRRTVANAQVLAATLADLGARVVSGGTDNHLMLIDVTPLGVTGKEAEHLLDEIGITVNKNGIPFDPLPPNTASGIRLGTPATTSRGFGEDEMRTVGRLIIEAIATRGDADAHARLAAEVSEITQRFPVPGLPTA